jgi:hypothetical protein
MGLSFEAQAGLQGMMIAFLVCLFSLTLLIKIIKIKKDLEFFVRLLGGGNLNHSFFPITINKLEGG